MADVAARQIEEQLAARGLGSPALVHAGLEQMQLGLAQGTLETKQQTVVVGGRIVRSVMLMPSLVHARCEVEVMSLARLQSLEGNPGCLRFWGKDNRLCCGVRGG